MRIRNTCRAAVIIVLLPLTALPPGVRVCAQAPGHVVISEVYGGGGNSGATYTHDFVELYNPTASDVVMTDWSLQYQSGGGAGAFTAIAKFSGTVRARRFFLVQANPGSGGTAPLPAPDAVAGITLAASSGKIALCSDTVAVTGPLDPGVVDFVGYGTSNLFEGSGPAIAPGNTSSVERKATAGSDAGSMGPGGAEEGAGNARDSDDNANDFIRRDPAPQNDSSDAESPGGALSLTTAYGEKWNLVSLPVDVADPSADSLFRGAVSPLYAYRSGYVGESTAVRGQGYWVRFAAPESVSFVGAPGGPDTVDLLPGWNLVGSASSPLAGSGVEQIPPGNLDGGFYGYDAGYYPADTLWPGRAYWVRSPGGGKIVLGAGGPGAGRSTFRDHDGQSPPPPPQAPPAPVEAPDSANLAPAEAGGRPPLVGIWPNPFNPVTRIGFSLAEAGPVRLDIVDLAGRCVAVLVDGPMEAGSHAVDWDAGRGSGSILSAGTYFVRLRAGDAVATRKVLYLR